MRDIFSEGAPSRISVVLKRFSDTASGSHDPDQANIAIPSAARRVSVAENSDLLGSLPFRRVMLSSDEE